MTQTNYKPLVDYFATHIEADTGHVDYAQAKFTIDSFFDAATKQAVQSRRENAGIGGWLFFNPAEEAREYRDSILRDPAATFSQNLRELLEMDSLEIDRIYDFSDQVRGVAEAQRKPTHDYPENLGEHVLSRMKDSESYIGHMDMSSGMTALLFTSALYTTAKELPTSPGGWIARWLGGR